jgi:hypothetical protein
LVRANAKMPADQQPAFCASPISQVEDIPDTHRGPSAITEQGCAAQVIVHADTFTATQALQYMIFITARVIPNKKVPWAAAVQPSVRYQIVDRHTYTLGDGMPTGGDLADKMGAVGCCGWP